MGILPLLSLLGHLHVLRVVGCCPLAVVQPFRLNLEPAGIPVATVDLYCAFAPNVPWWEGHYPIVSQKAHAGPRTWLSAPVVDHQHYSAQRLSNALFECRPVSGVRLDAVLERLQCPVLCVWSCLLPATVGSTSPLPAGFVTGYPRVVNDTITPHTVQVEVILYATTTVLLPHLSCFAFARGALVDGCATQGNRCVYVDTRGGAKEMGERGP